MSAVAVKSKKPVKVLSLAAVDELSSDFHVIVPALSADEPMPLDFNESWGAAKEQLEEAFYKNKGESVLRISKALNLRVTSANRLASWLNTPKRVTTVVLGWLAASVTLGTGLGVLFYGLEPLPASGVPGFLIGTLLSPLPAVTCVPLGQQITYDLSKKFFTPVLYSFEAGYEERVAQWAQERYGVTIPAGAWAGPADRVSKDIVYLGVKDGESVYCQQQVGGWVLTYKDGTELPVLVTKQKELVEA